MNKIALITGIAGQDGAYLAEMVRENMKSARGEWAKKHGFAAFDYHE
jgi:GDP-D-mannose dehydratase